MAEAGKISDSLNVYEANQSILETHFEPLTYFDPSFRVRVIDPKTKSHYEIRSMVYEYPPERSICFLFGIFEEGEPVKPVGIFQIGCPSQKIDKHIAYAAGRHNYQQLVGDDTLPLNDWERSMIKKYFLEFQVEYGPINRAFEIGKEYEGRRLGQLLLACAQLTMEKQGFEKIRLGQDETIKDIGSYYTWLARGESFNDSTWIDTKLTDKQQQLVLPFIEE